MGTDTARSDTPTSAHVVARFQDLRVLVAGDAVLDGWLYGSSSRLSREAPVPVVDVSRVELTPGGAANTAANAAALGARVRFVGIVGDDQEGRDLRRLLREQGVDESLVFVDAGRGTPTKRRVVCDGQVVARFDQCEGDWTDHAVRRLEDAALAMLDEVDVVIVSDYDGGSLSEEFRRRFAEARPRVKGPVLVDSHDVRDWRECAPTVVTPNAAETAKLLGTQGRRSRVAVSRLVGSSEPLLAETGADMVVTTVDAQGSLLHLPGQAPHRTRPAGASTSFGTCGAGDTFAATFALALGAGASPELSADLAQLSADTVVGREGTSVCSSQDLLLACGQQPSSAVTPVCDIAETVRRHRAHGRRIVFTNGCFDILHAGHATYLEQARQLGDLLVVGVNSDSSVRRLKGPDRPLVPETERARLVGALDSVDLVAIFEEDSPQGLIELLRPDVYVKGGDYTAEMLPETELVRRLGGQVVLVDYVADHSTTGIVERIRAGGPAAAPESRVEG